MSMEKTFQLSVGNVCTHVTQGESQMVFSTMESSNTTPVDAERGQAKNVLSDAHGQ